MRIMALGFELTTIELRDQPPISGLTGAGLVLVCCFFFSNFSSPNVLFGNNVSSSTTPHTFAAPFVRNANLGFFFCCCFFRPPKTAELVIQQSTATDKCASQPEVLGLPYPTRFSARQDSHKINYATTIWYGLCALCRRLTAVKSLKSFKLEAERFF